MKIIPIKQLSPGMFVQSVTKQTGKIKIKNQGWVKTQAGIDKLIKAGILEVEIDPDKTLSSEQPKEPIPPSTSATPTEESFNPWKTTHSVNAEMKKAVNLYGEAKSLQLKAFDDIRSGNKIDVGPFQELASGFIDSVFRNQDALTCLTRMREKDAYLLEHSINEFWGIYS